MLKAREETLRLLRQHLSGAANRMKQFADRRRWERSFQLGDWFILKLHPFQQQSMCSSPQHKIIRKYYGPYLVLEKIGAVAYRLDLPASSLIHPFFHVSLLKKAHGIAQTLTPLPSVEGTIGSLFLP